MTSIITPFILFFSSASNSYALKYPDSAMTLILINVFNGFKVQCIVDIAFKGDEITIIYLTMRFVLYY